ncbi:hypothetical protein Tco_0380987 [Tanacetum coccineum]
MSKVLQERGFGSLPSSTETNPRDQVKSISTTIEADVSPICRIGSSQYAVSTGQNSTLLYKSRKTTVPFLSRLDNHYCEEDEGNYRPKFAEAYGASHINNTIPRKEKDPGSFTLPCYINNVCFDNALVDLGASVSVMPLLTYLNLGLGKLAHTKLTVELADMTIKYPKRIAENILVGIGKFTSLVDFIILDMLKDIKGRPFLSIARAKIDIYKRKITLRVREERIVFTSVKLASSLIKRVYMLSLRERMELNLEARLMGETLVLNRSFDPFLEDYIELNDLNEPFELRRNQGDDLIPTIEEGEVIGEFRTRDGDLDTRIDDYPSYCDDDKKIHVDCAHNLKFSCMIGFEFTHVNFFSLLYFNVMSKKFHNSIMKDKMVYKGDNVVGALMNVPIFVGTFSVVADFAVLEDMDAYRDEGMGEVIIGEPFLREVGIKARQFDGMITIYNGDDEVTYQMVRSHPRFKHHTNEQCNKIPPLLKSIVQSGRYRHLPCRVCKVWDDWEVDRYGNANLVIMKYLVNISKRRAFWSLNEDILKINDSDNQYAVSIKEDTVIKAMQEELNEFERLEVWHQGLGMICSHRFYSPKSSPKEPLILHCSSGEKISQSPRGIYLNQSKYALEIIKIYGMETNDLVDTPIVEKSRLDVDPQGKEVDPTRYRGMIGSLMYLTARRPDLQFTICMCARYLCTAITKVSLLYVATTSNIPDPSILASDTTSSKSKWKVGWLNCISSI